MNERLNRADVDPDAIRAWSAHLGRAVDDPQALRRQLSAGTLPGAFAQAATRAASAPALNLPDGSITHGALDQAAARATTILWRFGAERGQVVLLVASTELSTVVAYLAILRSGAAAVLANPAYTPAELARLARASGADLAIASGESLRRIAGADLPIRELIGLSDDDRHYASLLLSYQEEEPAPLIPLDPEAPALLAFTSATTGAPKCVPLSHRNLLASIRGMMLAWRWSADDRLVHSLPIAHQHGLGGIHATLLAGSQATLLAHFEPDQLLDVVANRGATVLFGVPTLYRRLVETSSDRLAILGRLRLFTSGSAALPVELGDELITKTGAIPLERYGSTEGGLNVSNLYDGPRILGTVGLPLPGIELALMNADGEVVPGGEVGEVLVRGPQVFSGYRGEEDPEFIFDWFRTGDLGVIDGGSGHLRLVGRTKEVILTGGLNVYPKEVESVLSALSGVEDVAVVGIPSPVWGEEVVAFVVGGDLSPEALIQAAARQLASYKLPKRIVCVAKIPRNEMGKVSRDRLLEGVAPPPPTGI